MSRRVYDFLFSAVFSFQNIVTIMSEPWFLVYSHLINACAGQFGSGIIVIMERILAVVTS